MLDKDALKETALKDTIKMWQWMLDKLVNEGITVPKEGYLEYVKEQTGIYPSIRNSCYLCEYTAQVYKDLTGMKTHHCPYCPVNWGKKEPFRTPCESSDSPYHKWVTAYYKEDYIKAIQGIINLCKSELLKFEESNG